MSMRYVGGLVTTTVNPYAANVTTSPNYAQYNGVFTLAQQAQATTSGQWCTDPFFKNTTLLLRADGTANGAQNNTFLDSSTNNFTITRNGNTTQGTFSPYGSFWSNYFDGSGDSLTFPSNAALSLSSGDFTVEFWVCCSNQTGTYNTIVGGDSSGSLLLSTVSSGGIPNTLAINPYGSGSIYSESFSFAIGTWYHIAASRSGTSLRVFVNGTQLGATVTNSTNFSQPSNRVAATGGYSQDFAGYISNLRIVKGTALYTSNFTPSTTPLTAISGTSLLTCQSNRFIDNSSNNFAITVNGNTSVQRFSPFNPTAAYSAATIGGSGYFDGSGDYLSVPASAQFLPGANTDFTFEVWVYLTATPGAQNAQIVGTGEYGTNSDWNLFVNSSRVLGFYINVLPAGLLITSSTAINLFSWNHIAVTRSGTGSNNLKIFLNGVNVGQTSTNITLDYTGNNLTLGADENGDESFLTGYISGLRLINGTGYTSITEPIAPPTAITNTVLLCNFTNAGIADITTQNDLETVGNAQVSTSVKKYGTGSLYFDGTGDWLTVISNPQLDLGSGDFTIEFWIYMGTVSGTQGITGKRTSEANYAPFTVELTSSALKLYMSTSGSSWAVNGLSTASLSTGTWYHYAFVRSGTTIYAFLNGVSVGSTGTVSGALMSNTSPIYIGSSSASPSGASAMNGYIDDLRITKGVARYVSNFTPPPVALPVQ